MHYQVSFEAVNPWKILIVITLFTGLIGDALNGNRASSAQNLVYTYGIDCSQLLGVPTSKQYQNVQVYM